jgi:hypothetical protein
MYAFEWELSGSCYEASPTLFGPKIAISGQDRRKNKSRNSHKSKRNYTIDKIPFFLLIADRGWGTLLHFLRYPLRQLRMIRSHEIKLRHYQKYLSGIKIDFFRSFSVSYQRDLYSIIKTQLLWNPTILIQQPAVVVFLDP